MSKMFLYAKHQAKRERLAYLIVYKYFPSLPAFWYINTDRLDRIELWYT